VTVSPAPELQAQDTDRQAPLLAVDNLRVSFGGNEVVAGVSFTAYRGRCLAIVGESGSGKSVTARTLVGLTGSGAHVRADRIELDGLDLATRPERAWRAIRGRDIGFVLQDALVSLDQLESGAADDVFLRPQHPYTQRLLTALPRLAQP
jgi:peptide/nickel transport system ATP-binding protein